MSSLRMLLMTLGIPPLAVSANTGDVNNTRSGAQCQAGVQYNTSGSEFACTNVGVYSTGRGAWLDSGDSADVWVERTLNSGTLNAQDPGSGRLQLNSTRTYEVEDTNSGIPIFVTCNVTFDFYDAASGGNLLDTVTIQLQASWSA